MPLLCATSILRPSFGEGERVIRAPVLRLPNPFWESLSRIDDYLGRVNSEGIAEFFVGEIVLAEHVDVRP